MVIADPADTRNEIAAMSDVEVADALVLWLLSVHDPEPEVQLRAAEMVHVLRDEAQRRHMKLVEAP